MKSLTVNGVNDALAEGLNYLYYEGIPEPSRNGNVLVAPGPVTTTYVNPTQRVLFSPLRDANPFFHLMEALWMLGGRNELRWLTQFVSTFGQFSDDGKTLHGAYGYRWRWHFDSFDQIRVAVETLRADQNSRRVVLAMWDPQADLGGSGKDLPCNTHIYLDARGGRLNMTVCCRSNDILWGAYGANMVHFSILQEYLAAWVGVGIGEYRQMSNNYHLYSDKLPAEKMLELVNNVEEHDYYGDEPMAHYPLVTVGSVTNIDHWDQDLETFLDDPTGGYTFDEPFFNEVATPMYQAWQSWKEKDRRALVYADAIAAPDWQRACREWLLRREGKFNA